MENTIIPMSMKISLKIRQFRLILACLFIVSATPACIASSIGYLDRPLSIANDSDVYAIVPSARGSLNQDAFLDLGLAFVEIEKTLASSVNAKGDGKTLPGNLRSVLQGLTPRQIIVFGFLLKKSRMTSGTLQKACETYKDTLPGETRNNLLTSIFEEGTATEATANQTIVHYSVASQPTTSGR
jgi:hypothetical protein